MATKTKHDTREAWLNDAAETLVGWLGEEGHDIDTPIRVGIGLPLGNARAIIGQCWAPSTSDDGSISIWVSPTQDDPSRILDILLHELVHAFLFQGDAPTFGHGKEFRAVATSVGLTGRMTATVASEDLKIRLADLVEALGPIPHAKLNIGGEIIVKNPDGTPKLGKDGKPIKVKGTGRRKQTTRMIKVFCEECGYTLRTTQRWLDVATPECPDQSCEANGLTMKIETKKKGA